MAPRRVARLRPYVLCDWNVRAKSHYKRRAPIPSSKPNLFFRNFITETAYGNIRATTLLDGLTGALADA